jgi:hypothetical protein
MTDQAAEQKLAFIKEARELLALFNDPAWATSAQQEDERHVIDFAEAIVDTRKNFPDLPEATAMSMVLGEADRILAYTGNSPDAALRAKAIAGFIHSMPGLLAALEASITFDQRVSELLDHNSKQLMENRAQRETIRALNARLNWLLDRIPGVQAS